MDAGHSLYQINRIGESMETWTFSDMNSLCRAASFLVFIAYNGWIMFYQRTFGPLRIIKMLKIA